MMHISENNEEYSLAQGSEMELKIRAYNKGFVGNQNTCG
jgi:hypothetical protein